MHKRNKNNIIIYNKKSLLLKDRLNRILNSEYSVCSVYRNQKALSRCRHLEKGLSAEEHKVLTLQLLQSDVKTN